MQSHLEYLFIRFQWFVFEGEAVAALSAAAWELEQDHIWQGFGFNSSVPLTSPLQDDENVTVFS